MDDPKLRLAATRRCCCVCEEGEVEYDPSALRLRRRACGPARGQERADPENLTALEKKSGCGRVIIEYNGMWLVAGTVSTRMPDNWLVYQCLATADGTTIKTYAGDNAMRGLLLDKLRGSELLVVNRAEAVNDDESRRGSSTSWCARPAAAATSPMSSRMAA